MNYQKVSFSTCQSGFRGLRINVLQNHRIQHRCKSQLQIESRISRRLVLPVLLIVGSSQPSASEGKIVSIDPKAKVLSLLSEGYSNYSPGPDLGAAVDALIQSSPSSLPNFEFLGQGVWEVFYAPHIAKMSSVLATSFDPILYVIQGTSIISNVRYSAPLLGEGWLSSSGTFAVSEDVEKAVSIHFDKFWVDVGNDSLRPSLEASGGVGVDSSADLATVDRVVGALGRAAFFPQFATFPVLYLDADLVVFQFVPLKSNIAVRRVPRPS